MEDAARFRSYTEHVKVISRDILHTQRARRTVVSGPPNTDVGGSGVDCREVFEFRCLLFDPQVQRIREIVPVVLQTSQYAAIDFVGTKSVKLRRILHRQGLQQDRMHQREDRSLAPIPKASVMMAITVKPGDLRI